MRTALFLSFVGILAIAASAQIDNITLSDGVYQSKTNALYVKLISVTGCLPSIKYDSVWISFSLTVSSNVTHGVLKRSKLFGGKMLTDSVEGQLQVI